MPKPPSELPDHQVTPNPKLEKRTRRRRFSKVISHKAYGFRTPKNYIRNLYHCMADLPLPKTMHTFV